MHFRKFTVRLLMIVFVISLVVYGKPFALFIPQTLLVNRSGFSQAVYDSKNELLHLSLSSDEKYRLWTPLTNIAPSMIRATLAQEDAWFYWHPGVNPISLLRAAFITLTSGKNIGGSTITMQLARIRYGLYTRSFTGKLKQIVRALLLEIAFTKDEILEAYLNLAPYGLNIEGVGAASRIYFDKSPKNLSNGESVTLSVIPQHPAARAPLATKDLTSLRLAEMRLTQRYREEEKFIPATAIKSKRDLPNIAPHFTARVISEFPHSAEITTYLDREIQILIERQMSQFIERNRKLNIKNASVLIVDNSTMTVSGYLGSAEYMNSEIQGYVDGVKARRSPGSALKPFIYGLAIEKSLIHPGTVLKDTAFIKAQYNPENFERDFVGPISATDALIRSRNIPAVMLLNQLSPTEFLNFLSRAQIKNLRDEKFYGLSMALGGAEVRLDELVPLYAMLARGGLLAPLRFAKDSSQSHDTALLSSEAARLTLEMLSENPRPQSRTDLQNAVRSIDIPWKTGTSYSFRDAWAIGIVGKYTVGVWVGNFDGKANPAFIGREAAGPLLFSIADGLVAQQNLYETWRSPGLNIKKISVCALSGQLPGAHCPHRKQSWFIPGKSPIETCSIHRKVSVDPRSGLRTCPASSSPGHDKVFEFWPSDLASLFAEAGLPRQAPPAYSPECQGVKVSGRAPLVTSPTAHTQYVLHGENRSIALSAVSDGDTKKIFWFIDDAFLGEVKSGDSLHWKPSPGVYIVRVVDEQARANQVTVTVTTP